MNQNAILPQADIQPAMPARNRRGRSRRHVTNKRRARRKSAAPFTHAVPTPLSVTPDKARADCFDLENSNFRLSIQIINSKGIHLFSSALQTYLTGPCRDAFLNRSLKRILES